MIGRRLLVFGGVALGAASAAGILALRIIDNAAHRAAAATADYLAGRVVLRGDWIMSQTEAADVPESSPQPPAASSAESDAPGD